MQLEEINSVALSFSQCMCKLDATTQLKFYRKLPTLKNVFG